MTNNARLFPTAMIALSACAAVAYLADGDWRRAGYWLCATGITAFVTF